jgi:hypothetical protein
MVRSRTKGHGVCFCLFGVVVAVAVAVVVVSECKWVVNPVAVKERKRLFPPRVYYRPIHPFPHRLQSYILVRECFFLLLSLRSSDTLRMQEMFRKLKVVHYCIIISSPAASFLCASRVYVC